MEELLSEAEFESAIYWLNGVKENSKNISIEYFLFPSFHVKMAQVDEVSA